MENEIRTKRVIFTSPFIICLFIFSMFYGREQLPSWSASVGNSNNGVEPVSLRFLLTMLLQGEEKEHLKGTGFVCHSDLHSDLCISNKQVRIDTSALTIYIPLNRSERLIRPYPRKEDETAMKLVTPIHILQGSTPPHCDYNHEIPALVFSSGGFTGNLFHEFNEVIIPLFLTSFHFKSRVHFIITDFKPWFVKKYKQILTGLSEFEIINPASLDGSVHCFPGAVIGLKYHDNLALNYSGIPKGYSMLQFKQFLRESFNLKIKNVKEIKRPVLVLISRKKTRMFLNENEMVGLMEELGFRVIVMGPKEMSDLAKYSKVVNSCKVMVGAHGAGLTNQVFLGDGAVVVQVVPLALEWASNEYFGAPAGGLGVKYLEYRIEPEESSLVELYGRDHPVIVDPGSVFKKGYSAARAVYVDGQNMNINLVRFKETLVEALELVEH